MARPVTPFPNETFRDPQSDVLKLLKKQQIALNRELTLNIKIMKAFFQG